MAGELSQVDRRIAQRVGQAQAILDVGCGNGRLTWYLAQETQRQVVGLDLSESRFSKAKNLAYKAGVRELVQCLKGDVHNLGFQDNHFDVVILAYTLHHIAEPLAALKEIHRVLRGGGTIIVSEFEVKESEKGGGCYQFSLSELMRTLVATGFGDIRWERVEDEVLLVEGSKIAEDTYGQGRNFGGIEPGL